MGLYVKNLDVSQEWWNTSLIPAFRKQRQEFEVSLVYIVSFRKTKAMHSPVSTKKHKLDVVVCVHNPSTGEAGNSGFLGLLDSQFNPTW